MGYSREEKARLDIVEKYANNYYFRKYKENPIIDNTYYKPYNSVAPWPQSYDKDDNIYIFLKNNIKIEYHAEENEFSDDKQSKEINQDFIKDTWNPFLSELGKYYLLSDFFEKTKIKHYCKTYSNWYNSSTFNELYTGDIKEYCKNALDSFDYCGIYNGKYKDYNGEFSEEIYIIADSLSDYYKRYIETVELAKKYNIESLTGPSIYFMTKDVFEQEKEGRINNNEDTPTFLEDSGFWGEYSGGKHGKDLFIKIAKGIYSAVDSSDEVDSENRVKLTQTKSDFIKKKLESNKGGASSKKIFNSLKQMSPIYKITLNKKTLSEIKYENGSYDDCYLYLMLDYDELKIDDECKLYLYNRDNNEISEIDLESEDSIIQIDIDDLKKGNSYLFIGK